MDNKELVDLLLQIPEFIKAAEIYKEAAAKMTSTLAEAVRKQPQAVIPEEELKKLERIITGTRCASPDISFIAKELARRLSEEVSDATRPVLKKMATETLKDASIPIEHYHVIEKDLRDIVDKKMKKKVFILWIVIIVLLEAIVGSTIAYYSGTTYWGKRYLQVYTSKYLTKEERATMKENSYLLSVLPRNYSEDPATAKLQIKQFESVLKKREKEAQKQKSHRP